MDIYRFNEIGGRRMSKYKVLKDNLKNVVGEEFEKTLPIIAEEYEAKIRRQAAEITRLLAENKELKEDKAMLNAKIDAYELYGDQHEEEYTQAFNQGAEAAWELARKIVCFEWNGGYTLKELLDIFQADSSPKILNEHTYHEAAAKVAEWERQKEEIKVGDVVSREGLYGVVKSVSDDWLNGITASGISFQWLKRKCTKTGRHIDIDSFLKQIGEEK